MFLWGGTRETPVEAQRGTGVACHPCPKKPEQPLMAGGLPGEPWPCLCDGTTATPPQDSPFGERRHAQITTSRRGGRTHCWERTVQGARAGPVKRCMNQQGILGGKTQNDTAQEQAALCQKRNLCAPGGFCCSGRRHGILSQWAKSAKAVGEFQANQIRKSWRGLKEKLQTILTRRPSVSATFARTAVTGSFSSTARAAMRSSRSSCWLCSRST